MVDPAADEAAIASELRRLSPSATPNIRLVALGNARHLDVSGDVEIVANVKGEITLHDLAVIEVELKAEVWLPDALDDLAPFALMVDEIAGNVPVVDRLDEERDPVLRKTARREPEIVDI